MSGVDIVSVKSLLGHRNIESKMRYSHLSPDQLRQAVNRGSLADHLKRVNQIVQPTPAFSNLGGNSHEANFPTGTGSKTGRNVERQEADNSQTTDSMVRPVGIEPTTLSLEGTSGITETESEHK